MTELKLCYVKKPWAYFTTAPLNKQWGDDWNDIPFEYNAEEPYEWRKEYKTEPYEIVKIAWEGPFLLPNHGHINSPFSVEAINRGDIAWLRPNWYFEEDNIKPVMAGTSLDEFIKIMHNAGGNIYEKKHDNR